MLRDLLCNVGCRKRWADLMESELDRPELVIEAERWIARGSRSFALASRLFDRQSRERVWLLYGWCRACDDIADGQILGHGMTPQDDTAARVTHARDLTLSALRGETTGEAAFDALGVVTREVNLPHALPLDLIRGFELDGAGFRPADIDDLLRYCYHVAGVVGLMMAIVMGVDPRDRAVLDRACDLGIAFQLANIARDVREDAAAGRCYLPADWLADAGLTEEMLAVAAVSPDPALAERVAVLTKRLAALSARYEASALHGTGALPFRAAWAVLAAAHIYGGIAREVARQGAKAWDRRVTTSSVAKLGWTAKALLETCARARRWPGDGPREGLWTRLSLDPSVP